MRRPPKPKSRRKSNAPREVTSAQDFSFTITKVAVSQICKSVGFRRCQVSALETLTLVATNYLEALAKSARSFSNAAARTQSNLLDLTNALHDLSLPVGFLGASALQDINFCLLQSSALKDLSRFVRFGDEIPFAKPIEKARLRDREEVKTCTGKLQQLGRGGHVPHWLPEFPQVGGDEQGNTKRVNGEELWEKSSPVLGCQSVVVQEKSTSGNGGNLAKERARVKLWINGGKSVRLDSCSCRISLFLTEDEEIVDHEKPVKSKEAQILVYKRKRS